MRTLFIAAAAGLMTLSSMSVAAASPPQQQRYDQNRGDQRNDHRGDNDRGDHGRGDSQWGRWDNSWGGRPNGPPRGWTRTNDWYRHVRACQVRYRSYNPRTDTYVVRRNVVARCRL